MKSITNRRKELTYLIYLTFQQSYLSNLLIFGNQNLLRYVPIITNQGRWKGGGLLHPLFWGETPKIFFTLYVVLKDIFLHNEALLKQNWPAVYQGVKNSKNLTICETCAYICIDYLIYGDSGFEIWLYNRGKKIHTPITYQISTTKVEFSKGHNIL